MPLNDFADEWQVGSSGRPEFPQGKYFIAVAGSKWWLKDATGNDLVGQTDHEYHENRNMICCTLKIGSIEYYFEAALAIHTCGTKRVIYGHLFPKILTAADKDPLGEGATGGWSAEQQGDPPPPW